MTFNQLIKKILAVFIVVFLSINLYSIEEKDYKNMTARDRILLAISYYEVSIKYEGLNNKALAQSYRKEALKIEQNVEKYYKGEMEIPQKTIEIDWNSIFTNDNTDDEEDLQSEDYQQDEDEYLIDDEIDDEDLFADIDLTSDEIDFEDVEVVDTTDDVAQVVDTTDDVAQVVDTTDDVAQVVDTTDDVAQVVDTTDDVAQVVDTTDDVAQVVDTTDDVAQVVDTTDDVAQVVDTIDDATEIVDITAEIEDETDDEWNVSSYIDDDPSVVISQMIRNFFININEKNPDIALVNFADSITFQNESFTMTKDELTETIKLWCEEHDEQVPEYVDMTVSLVNENIYEAQVLFDKEFNFFVPMQKTIVFNIVKDAKSYLINGIKLVQSIEETNLDENKGFVYRFISTILSNDFEIASTYLADYVWINVYNMSFPSSEVLDHLESWRLDNADIVKPEEVVDFETVSDDEFVAMNMIEVLGINREEYQIISFKVLNTSILPGNPDKNVFSIIVGKNGTTQNKIIGIAQ